MAQVAALQQNPDMPIYQSGNAEHRRPEAQNTLPPFPGNPLTRPRGL
jgi:hypothetical protein